jgi:hypothetical protein
VGRYETRQLQGELAAMRELLGTEGLSAAKQQAPARAAIK